MWDRNVFTLRAKSTMVRPLFAFLLPALCAVARAADSDEPELAVEGQDLIVNAGAGSIIMKYAGGTTTTVSDVMAKLQQLEKSFNDLQMKLSKAQNASQMQYNTIKMFASCQAQGQGYDVKSGQCTSILPQCKSTETLQYNTAAKSYVCSGTLLAEIGKLTSRLTQAESTTANYANLLNKFSTCQQQGGAYNSTSDQCNAFVPQCTREGETLSFQKGSNFFVCSSFLLETVNRIKGDVNVLLNSQTPIGDQPSIPGKTCRDIKAMRPRALSGVYWISPSPNGSAPYQVYCDMLTDGGGWTLVTIIKGHGADYDKKYPLNGMNEDRLLADRTDEWASLNQTKFNAIFDARNDSIMRVYASAFAYIGHGDRSRYPRTYYLKKLKNKSSFDAFASLRYVPEWGSKSKSEYKLNYDRPGLVHPYNPDTHDFSDSGKTMNHWEDHNVIINGKKYLTSRHGIVGDAYSSCEWLFMFHVTEKSTAINCLSSTDVFAKVWIK